MKTLLIAVSLLGAVTLSAPLHAASQSPALTLEQLMNASVDRRGRGCDTAHDIATKPKCQRA
ncbi:MAG: hypothetical protein ABI832_15685 [bacterium]